MPVLLAALSNESIGWTIFIVLTLGLIAYAVVNVVRSGKAEVGSELEVAANRKPYYSDEELEGPKLDRTLTVALLMLLVVAVGLPFYWLMEPGRQSNAKTDFDDRFVAAGAKMFAPTADGGFNCAGCHGAKGVGASTDYNLTLPDGTIKVVSWKAPALNTVLLRYSRDEVLFILTYGRPFSPMPAWGVTGGGPLNDQQLQNLIDYLESIQLSPDQAQQAARDNLAEVMTKTGADGRPIYRSEGEALFNLGLTDGFAGGAYSCGRCHTQAWSYASSVKEIAGHSGCGALGPSLCGGSVTAQFPLEQDHLDFVSAGSELGKKYGVHGQGSGKMPGFGQRTAEPALFWINKGKEREPGPGMLPDDLIQKIVRYERGL
ncbi:MAG: c-type cytochrome [Acidimicrobiales bacterium]